MKGRKAVARALPMLVLAAAYAVSVGIFALWGGHNLDADMSAEMILAAQLNEEGALISENWLYDGQARVVSPVMVYQLGLLLFDSWHAARVFAIALLLALAAASLLFLARGAGMGEEALYAAAAMMLPTSVASACQFAHGAFYAMDFILACLMLGLLVRLPRRRRALPALPALLMLGAVCGLGGERMPVMLGVPLALLCAGGILRRAMGARTMREAMACTEGRLLPGALAVSAGLLAGYAVNALVLTRRCRVVAGGERIEDFGLELVLAQFGDVCGYLGWGADGRMIGLGGLCAFGAIAVTALMVYAPARLSRASAGAGEGVRIVARFALAAVWLGVLLNAQTNRSGSPYTVARYIAGLMLSLLCVYALLARLTAHMPGLRMACMLALTAVFAASCAQYVAHDVRKTPAAYEALADDLLRSGLTQGFATYENAGVLTEASDGAIEVCAYDGWNDAERSCESRSAARAQLTPQGRAFVYVAASEWDEYETIPCAIEENLAWESEYGRVYVFEDAAQVMKIQGEQ